MRAKLTDLFLEKIKGSDKLKEKFKELGISELDIRKTIEEIIGKSPTLIIPIDKISADLKCWAQVVKNEVIILEIEKYINEQTQEVIYRIPEYMRFPPLGEEEAKENIRKEISREEFLTKCSEPARILFTKLEKQPKKK